MQFLLERSEWVNHTGKLSTMRCTLAGARLLSVIVASRKYERV
jgi:hypothetical protein